MSYNHPPSKLNCTLLRSCETRYYFKCVCAVRLLLYLVFCVAARKPTGKQSDPDRLC
ncbi:hypothetical protein ABMA28_008351 [Loxostege sticticalis]|uniref:Uncharacterized protein n=1 Tax=Loxostege sticticalis TaxID=481309 RepID=A0ABD0SGW7_LOXSC